MNDRYVDLRSSRLSWDRDSRIRVTPRRRPWMQASPAERRPSDLELLVYGVLVLVILLAACIVIPGAPLR